jgi:hypothetical protein
MAVLVNGIILASPCAFDCITTMLKSTTMHTLSCPITKPIFKESHCKFLSEMVLGVHGQHNMEGGKSFITFITIRHGEAFGKAFG